MSTTVVHIIFFIGIFTSRFLKRNTTAWFRVHVFLMTSCLLCIIASTVIIFKHLNGWSTHPNNHHIIGSITILTMIVQPIMALVRPSRNQARSVVFHWVHGFMGHMGWLLGGFNIILAFNMVGQSFLVPACFCCVVVLLFTVCEIYVHVARAGNERSFDSVVLGNTTLCSYSKAGGEVGVLHRQRAIKTVGFAPNMSRNILISKHDPKNHFIHQEMGNYRSNRNNIINKPNKKIEAKSIGTENCDKSLRLNALFVFFLLLFGIALVTTQYMMREILSW